MNIDAQQKTGPCVGIFWAFITDGTVSFAVDSIPLSEAEDYGDFLTHPRGHYEVWENWQALGSVRLKKRGLPTRIVSVEYEVVPRGRIVFDRPSETFLIYADRKLQDVRIIEQIVRLFGLSGKDYVIRSDSHYVS
jgi:hypothetical protein